MKRFPKLAIQHIMQHPDRYQTTLPGMFDDTLTQLQKMNKLTSHLAAMDAKLHDVIVYVESVANITEMNIDEMQLEIKQFKEQVLQNMSEFEKTMYDYYMPQSVEIILQEWFNNGKLFEIISEQVFEDFRVNLDGRGINVASEPFNIKPGVDSTIAMQALVDIVPEHTKLIFPDGEYLFNIVSTKALKLEATSKATFKGVEGVLKPVWHFTGEITQSYPLSSSLNRGMKTIPLLANNLAVGDYVIIKDNTVRNGDNLPNINLEVHQIGISNPTSFEITDFIRLPKAATTQGIQKMKPLFGVEVHNIHFTQPIGIPGNEAAQTDGLRLTYCVNPIVTNITAEHIARVCVNFESCYNVNISKFNFKNPQYTGGGQGYGVLATKGTLNINISEGVGFGMRHIVDCGNAFDVKGSKVSGFNNVSATFMLSHNGYDSDIVLSECYSYDVAGSANQNAFRTSAQAFTSRYESHIYNIQVLDCKAYLGSKTSYYSAMQFDNVVHGLVVRNAELEFAVGSTSSSVYGISTYPYGTSAIIEGCSFKNFAVGIRHYDNHNFTPTKDEENIIVQNSMFKGCATGIYALMPRKIILSNITFEGCTKNVHYQHYSDSVIFPKELVFENLTSDQNTLNIYDLTFIEPYLNNLKGYRKNMSPKNHVPTSLNVANNTGIRIHDLLISDGFFAVNQPEQFNIRDIDRFYEGYVVTIMNHGTELVVMGQTNNIKNKEDTAKLVQPGEYVNYVFLGEFWYEM